MMREELLKKLKELGKKYYKISRYKENDVIYTLDLFLKKEFIIPGKKCSIINFGVSNRKEIYIMETASKDIYPRDFDDQTLERFVNYISDEDNVVPEF